mmetsp:Transcript_13552/g.44166  ORF Transcript_13552/g.44166 Transcript_13552/m.44166 type:complete len:218 (+) Transcript_13552:75-728(+)
MMTRVVVTLWCWLPVVMSLTATLKDRTIAARRRVVEASTDEEMQVAIGELERCQKFRFESASFVDLAVNGDWRLTWPRGQGGLVTAVSQTMAVENGNGRVVNAVSWNVDSFRGTFETTARVLATDDRATFRFQVEGHALKPTTPISRALSPQTLVADIARAAPKEVFDPKDTLATLVYADPDLKLLKIITPTAKDNKKNKWHVWSRQQKKHITLLER